MATSFVNEHEYLGEEYDWVAVDSCGRLGYFSTAGVGPIPSDLFKGGYSEEELFEKVMGFPETTRASQVAGFDKNVADWLEVAKRGIYSFDWSRELAGYQLIASPDHALNTSSLDSKVYELFNTVKLDCDFVNQAGAESLLVFG